MIKTLSVFLPIVALLTGFVIKKRTKGRRLIINETSKIRNDNYILYNFIMYNKYYKTATYKELLLVNNKKYIHRERSDKNEKQPYVQGIICPPTHT
jgi:hypothetical protein